MKNIKLSDEFIAIVKNWDNPNNLSLALLIENYAVRGRVASENPEFPYKFIEGFLEGLGVALEKVEKYRNK